MPGVTLHVGDDSIYRCSERNNSRESVLNFNVRITAAVESIDVDASAKKSAGSGFLSTLKRYPDGVERQVCRASYKEFVCMLHVSYSYTCMVRVS